MEMKKFLNPNGIFEKTCYLTKVFHKVLIFINIFQYYNLALVRKCLINAI